MSASKIGRLYSEDYKNWESLDSKATRTAIHANLYILPAPALSVPYYQNEVQVSEIQLECIHLHLRKMVAYHSVPPPAFDLGQILDSLDTRWPQYSL